MAVWIARSWLASRHPSAIHPTWDPSFSFSCVCQWLTPTSIICSKRMAPTDDALPGPSWRKTPEIQLRLTCFYCVWLILQLVVWNLVYGSKIIDPRLTSDSHSPAWLLIAENITRFFLFALPLVFPL